MLRKMFFLGLFVLSAAASAQATCKVELLLSIDAYNQEQIDRAKNSMIEGVKAKGYEIVEMGSKSDLVLYYGTEAAGVASAYWGRIELFAVAGHVAGAGNYGRSPRLVQQSTLEESSWEAFVPVIQDRLVASALIALPAASAVAGYCKADPTVVDAQ